jgi:hypothetical protein
MQVHQSSSITSTVTSSIWQDSSPSERLLVFAWVTGLPKMPVQGDMSITLQVSWRYCHAFLKRPKDFWWNRNAAWCRERAPSPWRSHVTSQTYICPLTCSATFSQSLFAGAMDSAVFACRSVCCSMRLIASNPEIRYTSYEQLRSKLLTAAKEGQLYEVAWYQSWQSQQNAFLINFIHSIERQINKDLTKYHQR